ncbi:putative ferric-chelate reductase 1 [Haliotis rufescens]|uniref:putative ferric-chelate reductase 1 n=1 Tax=Haliotis rufescens TaxID=6454 RepID=UPI00201F312C|nr:putative ferric-chelate reductase 1 [Haliotis rufescens]XP_048246037.1 putative ferric-chelate reductase 1 [Haliotis rufescens]XP_048246038.1 putative ferric-chelate reductase 1 [Haliotis rufescens]XP_048246039.1 putative ferric-chelate reductase 1 [Haliotis rufescens]XP_048246040.1 putative ferric-chelate reductase 1 [Haliotis rufescens]XP_048246041.1 putative ferric-chelate reductase 1 [Haliotis rufescens]XP_048246042.1 putative ferric-chelate reductase 1 [Haliotis rufescens]
MRILRLSVCPRFVLLLVLVFAREARAYTSGAGTTGCASLTPSHTTTAQTTDSPFVVLTSKTTYTAGETIEVTLEGRCGEEFGGFLIQARRADPNNDNDELIGEFTSIDAATTQKRCNNGDATERGLTHINSSPKSRLTLQWTAPTPATGHIIFRTTFVKTEPVFWVGVTSAVLTDATAGALSVTEASLMTATMAPCTSTTGGTTVSTAPSVPSVGISRDPECGKTKGCFDNCDTGCTFSVTWSTEGSNIRFQYKSLSSGNSYFAIGFSGDTSMGGDSVTECVVFGGVVKAFQSFNAGYSNSRLASPEDGISGVSGSVNNGVFDCTFLRETGGTSDPNSFNLTQDFYLLAAQGVASAGFAKSKHGSLPTISAAVIDLQETSISGAVTLEFVLVKAHGSLMSVAWLLLASVGMVIARFYKLMWPDTTVGGANIWFQVHRACMTGTLLFTVIAFILIFVEVEGYTKAEEPGQKAHPILGIVATILVVLNPIMALLRPGPKSERRVYFNWAHFLVGKGAFLVAGVAILFGMRMPKASAPLYMPFIVAGYLGWHLLVEGSLEIIRCLSTNKGKQRVNNIDQEASSKPQYATLMLFILCAHICVAVAFACTVVWLLAAV